MRRIVVVLFSLLAAAPFAFVATVLLAPLWNWVERTTGVESVGHSGPAAWCYGVVYVVGLTTIAAGAGLYWKFQREQRARSRD